MTRIFDADGTPLRRDRDGDLVPTDPDPLPTPVGDCPDHGPGYPAARCIGCHADVLAGDRPRTHIGRTWSHPQGDTPV